MYSRFLITFAVCLVCCLFHTMTHYLEHKGHKVEESKVLHPLLSIAIFAGYSAWGFMMAWDPVDFSLPGWVALPLGLAIGMLGSAMLVISTIAKKGFGEIDHLVTTGIYSRIRHPMYLGLIMMHVGFPLAAGGLLTLISAVIWIPLILMWKRWEEQALEAKFGLQYSEYRKRTLF